MPHFDETVTMGNLLTIAAMVIAGLVTWNAFKTWTSVQIATFRATLDAHAQMLKDHTQRMVRYEERNLELVGDVQLLIGSLDLGRRKSGRRHDDA